jgi:two-component system, NarL family, response regulator DesR
LAPAALSEGESLLTDREREVLPLRRTGQHQRIEDVARKPYLSGGTVRIYFSTSIKKLGPRNRVGTARLVERKGRI